jgi:dipeptidyl aminopeptidase/acylaminoacyl peptidase
MFTAASPLERAKDIQAPVLMVYGLQDRRVPIVHGEKMRDALRALGKPVEWVMYQEEGHGVALERNRFDLYQRIAAFLAQHNPPD